MMKKWEKFEPDYIFYNGSVHSVDSEDTIYEAIAVSGNTITAVGSSEEVLALAAAKTKCIDVCQKTIMPGINDSHNHIWEAGLMFDGLVLFGIDSIQKLKEKIAKKVKTLPKGAWLQGGSYIESQFAENRALNRWDLDEAAPEHAVVLERIFGACVVNSKALAAAHITRDTENPPKGQVEKDAVTGEPTGVLYGTAVLLVRAVMPGPFGSDEFGAGTGEPSVPMLEKSIRLALDEYKKYGITSNTEPGVSAAVCKAYHKIYEDGHLTCRMSLMPNWHGFTLKQDEAQLNRLIDSYNFHTGYGNEWIRYSGLKMAIDGGLTSGTALKSWPYKGEDSLRKLELRLDIDKLEGYIKQAHDSGWDIGIHVMGDIAIEKAVDAIYKAVKANPRKHTHSIIHAYYPTKEALDKMAEVGIIAVLQGSFIYGEADGYDDLLPKDKQESFTPGRSYIDAGVLTTLSTDMPCAHVNPFWNMYAIVTRKGMRGYCLGTSERITVTEAIRMMTYNGAVLNREQDIKGSLEPGKLADLVVLDRNILQTEDEALKNITVEMTMLDGKIIYTKHETVFDGIDKVKPSFYH